VLRSTPLIEQQARMMLDPSTVRWLNNIVEKTKCLVVLSSSWRQTYPLTTVNWMLHMRGFEYTIFAATPKILNAEGKAATRAEEIAWWLSELGCDPSFVILDDGADMYPFEVNHVRTDYKVGLTYADAQRVCRMLEEGTRQGQSIA
jgi:hypothetical protein